MSRLLIQLSGICAGITLAMPFFDISLRNQLIGVIVSFIVAAILLFVAFRSEQGQNK